MAGPISRRRDPVYCPACNSKGAIQPVLVEMQLHYEPQPEAHIEQDYSDRVGNPQWKYECPRCKLGEIHLGPPT